MPRRGNDITKRRCRSDCRNMSYVSPAATSLETIAAGGSLHETSMSKVKRIAIIGAGPTGAKSIDAFAQEQAFDIIRVFERRERPGGCW